MRYLAFYLPQYHPIPENDDWWGKGFTEWTNVAKSRPRFKGHYQPHIPADLGFYDLRRQETMELQADMAQEYGLSGFCFYHYWFNGKLLLERPIEEMLARKKPNFPFCLCWANENWTKVWDGQDRDVLMHQEYSMDDCEDHIRYLANYFADSRYILVNGKPLIIIYRPDLIPDPVKYFRNWRKVLRNEFDIDDIYIVGVKSGLVKFSDDEIISSGYDAVLDFQPNRDYFPLKMSFKSLMIKTLRFAPNSWFQFLKRNSSLTNVISYKDLVHSIIAKKKIKLKKNCQFPSVFPSWDNSARRNSPTIIQNHDGHLFQKWLLSAKNQVSSYSKDEQIVFINAWNEWAEGCHLEPDLENRFKFLEALASVANKNVKLK